MPILPLANKRKQGSPYGNDTAQDRSRCTFRGHPCVDKSITPDETFAQCAPQTCDAPRFLWQTDRRKVALQLNEHTLSDLLHYREVIEYLRVEDNVRGLLRKRMTHDRLKLDVFHLLCGQSIILNRIGIERILLTLQVVVLGAVHDRIPRNVQRYPMSQCMPEVSKVLEPIGLFIQVFAELIRKCAPDLAVLLFELLI